MRRNHAIVVGEFLEGDNCGTAEQGCVKLEVDGDRAVVGFRYKGSGSSYLVSCSVQHRFSGALIHQGPVYGISPADHEAVIRNGIRQDQRLGCVGDMQPVRIRQGRPDVRDRYRLAAVVDILMTGDNGIVSCQLLKRYQSAAAKVCCVDNEFNIHGSRRGFRFEGYFLSDFVSVAVLHDLPGAFIDQAGFQDVAHVRRQVFIGNCVYDCYLSRCDKFLLVVRSVSVCPDFGEADGFVPVQNVVVQVKLFIAVIQRGKGNYRSAGK